MRPTFIGIGAQKCASSWIYEILADHPEAAVSKKKELDFFSYWFEHGYDWYERKFPSLKQAKAIGEVSPSYFHDPRVPRRIVQYDDSVKLILTLRDPIERAYSQHKHEVRIGAYTGPDFSFEAGLRQNPGYIEQGLFATHLRNWLRYFPRERIEVVLFEQIKAAPEKVAQRVYRFLGITESHRSAWLNEKANLGFVIRSRTADNIKNAALLSAQSIGAERFWKFLAQSPIGSAYRAANRIDSEVIVPAMLPETRIKLSRLFEREVLELEREFGITLAS